MDAAENGRPGSPLGDLFTEAEVDAAVTAATQKLASIISRFGDENGERRKPYYFKQLIKEELQIRQLQRHLLSLYEEKERTAHA